MTGWDRMSFSWDVRWGYKHVHVFWRLEVALLQLKRLRVSEVHASHVAHAHTNTHTHTHTHAHTHTHTNTQTDTHTQTQHKVLMPGVHAAARARKARAFLRTPS